MPSHSLSHPLLACLAACALGLSAASAATTPQSQAVAAGGNATLSTSATGTIQWQRDGTSVAGATSGTLTVNNVQPASAGIYTASITNGSTTTTQSAILGVSTTSKVIGTGSELEPKDITHPNGNKYDQILLSGAAATLTADAGQASRMSFIDLNDDIVQVEFAGAGTLTLVLDSASGPAAPTKYNQPSAAYMKGHASIIVTGANETTNLTIFTVGRATAFDPTGAYNIAQAPSATNNPANNGSSLFQGHASTNYDGFADIAYVAVQSTNGKFGGIRTANTSYFATKGFTGVYAPGVEFTGPVFVHDINASGTATPVILTGSVADARVTGGNLKQDNNRAVQISGIAQLKFSDGTSSHNTLFAAQASQARLEDNGADVTSTVAVNPSGSNGGGTTAGQELTFEFTGANPPYPHNSKKTFEVSLTTLKFDGKTLTNPTPMTLNPPMTGARFTDPATGFVWEVYFRNSTLHEINIMRNGQFAGQWN